MDFGDHRMKQSYLHDPRRLATTTSIDNQKRTYCEFQPDKDMLQDDNTIRYGSLARELKHQVNVISLLSFLSDSNF